MVLVTTHFFFLRRVDSAVGPFFNQMVDNDPSEV
jgi:hypothetical protein